MNKKIIIIFSVFLISLLIIFVFFVPIKQEAPSSTRVIVDHYKHKYATPECYKYNEASNYLDELTLKDAQDLKYRPINECTKKQVEPIKKTLYERAVESLTS